MRFAFRMLTVATVATTAFTCKFFTSHAAIDSRIGSQAIMTRENCKNCKDDYYFEFWECDHGAEDDECDDTKCIHNYFRWFECEKKAEESEAGKCEAESNFALNWREQWTHQAWFHMSCGDDEMAGVPGGPDPHECSFRTEKPIRGRCLLGAEDFVACEHGDVVDHQALNGLFVCKD